MKLYGKLFLCAAILFQVAFSEEENEGRIVGGAQTVIDKLPYQAAVLFGGYLCGGTIIAPQFVVTAAHCTAHPDDVRKAATVRVGSSYFRSGGKVVPISNIYDHPGYIPKRSPFDVSVLKLSTVLQFSSTISAAKLPTNATRTGDIVTVSGWGATSDGGSISEIIKTLSIPFITSSDCRKTAYGTRITADMCCAGFSIKQGTGSDSCQGDSGGPLVSYVKGIYELVGIVSWGEGCATNGYPGVYADAFYFKDFINSVINNSTAPPSPTPIPAVLPASPVPTLISSSSVSCPSSSESCSSSSSSFSTTSTYSTSFYT